MLHKEIPFLRLVVPLAAGILAGYHPAARAEPVIYMLPVAAIILVFPVFRSKIRPDTLFGAATTLMLFCTGFLLLRHELSWADELEEKETVFICRVRSFPEKKTASYAFFADIKAKADTGTMPEKTRGGLMIYHTPDDKAPPGLEPGDMIMIRTRPEKINNRGNPFEFDYQAFMLRKGVRYRAFTRQHTLTTIETGNRKLLKEKALITGRKISSIYEMSGIDKPGAALLSALTLGYKEQIDEETREHFARAGVMHVMAVSGLHAGIISMFIFSILFFLKRKLLILRVGISIVFLWAFAFITGLTPSVIRASLMFTFLHTGKLLKRPVNNINSILASAFFMLIVNPSDLGSLSFQLSYSAVLFISAFYKDMASLLRTGFRPADWLWQLVVVSLLAQAGTMPLTLNAFGRFPAWFLPANLAIIPMASVIIIGASILIILHPFPLLTNIFAMMLNRLTALAYDSASLVASLPGNDNHNLFLPWPETISLLLLTGSLLFVILRQKQKRIIMPLTALLIFAGVSTVRHISTACSSDITVYNEYGSTSVGFRKGHSLLVVADSSSVGEAAARHAGALSLNIVTYHTGDGAVLVRDNTHTSVICTQADEKLLMEYKPDILITGKLKYGINPAAFTGINNIIVTSGNPGVIMTAGESIPSQYRTSLRSVQSEGAISIKLHRQKRLKP